MKAIRGSNTENLDSIRVLLLAAGLGTRLRPVTDSVPKCLVPIAGRPLLDYWFDRFAESGLTEVRINTHYFPEELRRYIKAVNDTGQFKVTEAYEPKLLGSAGTVTANRDLADGSRDCLIVYADNLSDVDLYRLLKFHRSHEDPVTMMLFRTNYPENCGIALLDRSGRIVDFAEKPEKPSSNLANAGVYVVTAQACRQIADMYKDDLSYDVVPEFLSKMRGWIWEGYHRDIGTPESLENAQEEAREVFFHGHWEGGEEPPSNRSRV